MEPAPKQSSRRYFLTLSLGALGVVYGDIGTSPLYALRECFRGHHAVLPTHENVLGILSLICWSLIIVISLKYLVFVMRADNRGEGGILALMSLARTRESQSTRRAILIALGLFGSALLYGDGMITPAISVLSAIEGLEVATPVFGPYVEIITVVVLIILFVMQRVGTAKVGAMFGPVMLVWFAVISLLGIRWIIVEPRVLMAILPTHAVHFFVVNRLHGFLVLGAVFLAVTGGEALYADMGHFGARPIRIAWFVIVFPSSLTELLRPGRAAAARQSSGSAPVFPYGSGLGEIPARHPGHDRHGHRLASRHLRRVLADAAGRAARLRAAHPDPPHLRARDRTDLHSLGELAADDRGHRPRPGVQGIERAGRRVRRGGDGDDGHHDGAPGHRGA